jgi:hypothetical protein
VQQHDRKAGAGGDDVQAGALEREGAVLEGKRGQNKFPEMKLKTAAFSFAVFPEICSDPFLCFGGR